MTSPDLHVVSDDAQSTTGPVHEAIDTVGEELDSAITASNDAAATPSAASNDAPAMPSAGANGGGSPWVTQLVLEAAVASGAGAFAGFAAAPKTRRGQGSLTGGLVGAGTALLVRATLRPVVPTPQGYARLATGGRIGLGAVGAAALAGATWLAFFRKP